MSDPNDTTAVETAPADLSDQIGRSVSSIWQRHAGPRPDAVRTEVAGDSVRCTIEWSASAGGDQPADGGEPECYERSEVVRSPESSRYRNEASASVSRLTGRRVRGYVAKRQPEAGNASDTFILEPVQIYY